MFAVPTWCSIAQATLAVPGAYQTENGGATDWDPPTAPTMTETPPASGIHTLNLSGLAGSGAGTRYPFKILDDQGSPPAAWGDPELTPIDGWFLTDASGNASISIDTNAYSDGFQPATNRVTVSTDAAVIANFHAVGNWMNEAGGAGDWNPGDPMFAMSNLGGGLYGLDATISTPGAYEYKATKGDWDGQWGTNGRNINAGTWLFTTTEPGQAVRFRLDIGKGAISVEVVPEPASALLACMACLGTIGVLRGRK